QVMTRRRAARMTSSPELKSDSSNLSEKLTPEQFEQQTIAEIERRIKVLDLCATDPGFKADVIDLCRRDVVFFFNTFLWTFDPRTQRKKYPFKLWPYQERYIRWLEER